MRLIFPSQSGYITGFIILTLIAFNAAISIAELTRIEIISRYTVSKGHLWGTSGTYERIVGKAFFAVDPRNPHNKSIVDLDKAPLNMRNRVEFSADLVILKPVDPTKGNHTALFEVANRGGRGLIGFFDKQTSSTSDKEFADGFLLKQGYTMVWLGWQHDVPSKSSLLRLYPPTATAHGNPIFGLVRAQIILGRKVDIAGLGDRNHQPYLPEEVNYADAKMTVRDDVTQIPEPIEHTKWKFVHAPNQPDGPMTHVSLEGGFHPGKIYDVVYRSREPKVEGLGFAGVRDIISFLKYKKNVAGKLKYAIGFGVSQSGRFLRHFTYEGFNADEHNRKVFDGLLVHIGGAGRGSFNLRFGQASRDGLPFFNVLYPTDIFPFTDLAYENPFNSVSDGLLKRTPMALQPKIFYTNTSFEYWGRCAALIHVTPDGKRDAEIPPNSRIYLFAGGQHFTGAFPPAINPNPDFFARNPATPLDVSWSMRALLIDMQKWITKGSLPPPSSYPRIVDRTLVGIKNYHFPSIPKVIIPEHPKAAYELDFGKDFKRGIISTEPPKLLATFPVFIPQADEDGIDKAGIHLPEIAVPLATYTGWNLRDPSTGSGDELAAFMGSYLPFPKTHEERTLNGDPRKSIAERYATRQGYIRKFEMAAEHLVRRRLLLQQDLLSLYRRAEEHWDWATNTLQRVNER